MARAAYLTDEIAYISLYNVRPILLHGYVLPFVVLYLAWLYMWFFVYGIEEYFEAGCIAVAVIGLLQILTCLFCHWFVEVKCFMTCSKATDPLKATVVKVVPTPNNGFSELIALQKEQNATTGKQEIWFIFQKMKYICDWEEKKTFEQVTFPVDWSVCRYMDWKGYAEESDCQSAARHYGMNSMQMDIPTFMELFKERATAPFFVFQVFCVGLWCLDEYWYYSVFTLFMLVTFEATLVQQQMRNMTEIRKMGNKPYPIQVYRNRKWKTITSVELIPGDIVSVGRLHDDRLVPCDLLLLRGTCIVDESMLTGESVPVMKEPMESVDESTVMNIDNHGKLHVLFGGTRLVQHSAPAKTGPGMKTPDNGCVAFVLRNGFSTSQGRLLRTILYSVKRVTANNLETLFFILFLLCFAVTAASYVWIKGTEDPNRNKYKLFLECTLILTSVVPPELPIELSLAVNTSLIALSKLYVFCTEPFRIPFAGKVSYCCFDKTGTLTSDSLIVEGVAGLGSDGAMVRSVSDVPLETTWVMATCHSLGQLEDDLVGDPLDKAMLHAIDWHLTKGDAILPRKGKTHGLKIFHRFHFSSALKRMSVIAGYQPQGIGDTEYVVTTKGAPETVRDMLDWVPANYDDVYLTLARRGARVLALAYKKIGTLSHQEVRDLSREEAERNLTFAGFVIISCPLKRDSKAVVQQIMDSSHMVVMITGDNPLTACHVARELGMLHDNKQTLMLQHKPHSDDWQWQSIDGTITVPMQARVDTRALIDQYDFCFTGEAIDYLVNYHHDLFLKILPYTLVHARVAPKQKEFIITSLKQLGYTTLMCGDGTNDVGALKHAHVGVALLANAPEKMPERKTFQIPEVNTSTNGDVAEVKAPVAGRGGGKPQGKAAKMRAVTRGDDTTAAMSPGAVAMQKKLAAAMKEMEELEKAQLVRLGDASIASPFTSKLSTTMCVCHIIKQGRCTLVTTLQMFKILALNALILAYSQSVLYLDGVKFSDAQATMQGLLLAGCFLFISRSKPLPTLSKDRPLPNIFNVYTILTVILQFFVHFASLVFLKNLAEENSPPRDGAFVNLEEEFKPSLLNSTVYIISMAMQVTTFAVNYKGRPFMEGLTENKPLLYSLMMAGGAIIALASGLLPDVAHQFEIVEFTTEYRNTLVMVLAADLCCSFLLDRVCQFLFGHRRLDVRS